MMKANLLFILLIGLSLMVFVQMFSLPHFSFSNDIQRYQRGFGNRRSSFPFWKENRLLAFHSTNDHQRSSSQPNEIPDGTDSILSPTSASSSGFYR